MMGNCGKKIYKWVIVEKSFNENKTNEIRHTF